MPNQKRTSTAPPHVRGSHSAVVPTCEADIHPTSPRKSRQLISPGLPFNLAKRSRLSLGIGLGCGSVHARNRSFGISVFYIPRVQPFRWHVNVRGSAPEGAGHLCRQGRSPGMPHKSAVLASWSDRPCGSKISAARVVPLLLRKPCTSQNRLFAGSSRAGDVHWHSLPVGTETEGSETGGSETEGSQTGGKEGGAPAVGCEADASRWNRWARLRNSCEFVLPTVLNAVIARKPMPLMCAPS